MSWKTIVVLLSFLGAGNTMNKPVYKIILTQKGFAQFVQYDVEIPPLREFTFCTWIRVTNLDGDQSIFTYVVNGNSPIVRLWLDSGGRQMKVTINNKVSSSIPVDIAQDVWRHVCLSYQSDFGAWALYIDSRLASCEASQSLYGFVMPGSGSIIIGYGRTENESGSPKGLEGELFGANMILSSTIERNYTIKTNPQYEQKSFKRNRIKNNNSIEYVVLKDLQTDEIHHSDGNTLLPPYVNTTKSYVKFNTPYSFVEHNVGKPLRSRKVKQVDTSSEKEILDVFTDNVRAEDSDNRINFWSLVNDAGRAGKFNVKPKNNRELFSSSNRDLPKLTEYELPPPPSPSNQGYLEKNLETDKLPDTESIYNINNKEASKSTINLFNKRHMNDIADIETPPPLQDDKKIFGQWTSSRFAGSVLNYLKSINFHSKDRKVPATIPLAKYSDNYPYATNFKMNMIKPTVSLKRKNLIIEKRKYNQNTYMAQSPLQRLQLQKRNAKQPQINVQILQDDRRIDILRSHAKTKPKHVEVTVRSRPRKHMDHRFYRNVESQESYENSDTDTGLPKARTFNTATDLRNHKLWNKFDLHKTNSLLTVLPFLKSVEYFTEENENYVNNKIPSDNDMYSKSLSNANKWHNVKTYNNDYTPRRINMTQQFGNTDMDVKIYELNKKHPSIRLKYKPETDKLVSNYDDTNIDKGRQLALDVSNHSDYNKDSISILKYNHGFLPGHDEKRKTIKQNPLMEITSKNSKVNGKNSFNKHVKIGNALNEQHVIGNNEEQKKKSFVGGNERIPDIHRYRSDIDNEVGNAPSSIGPRACRNIELYDHILYVKPDESIDMSEILSPIKRKNIGIEFIMQTYKKCSLEDSPLRKSNLLLLHWSRTPVRLFGGAYPKKTTDLCGFF